jgi:hypothetical protein
VLVVVVTVILAALVPPPIQVDVSSDLLVDGWLAHHIVGGKLINTILQEQLEIFVVNMVKNTGVQ